MAHITERDDQYMHGRLPIGKNEKILAIYKHHWFAYASIWLAGIFVVAAIMGIAAFLSFVTTSSSADTTSHRTVILAGAGIFSAIVLLFTLVPVYLRSQEQVVLTEEALLQILQPSIFASKISQLNLQHIADVSVRQDFFGTIFGYGKISVETPGEQDNYEFSMIPRPQHTARQIIDAHENYQAAVESGRMPTTLGTAPAATTPQIDPAQYQQFLQYQQMVAQQQAAQVSTTGQATDSQQTTGTDTPAPQPQASTDDSSTGVATAAEHPAQK